MRRTRLTIAAALCALGAACDRGPDALAERAPLLGGNVDEGARLISVYGCGGCHTIPGIAGANALVGPPLTDFAARAYVAGRLPNEPPYLIRWIVDPQAIEPLTAMPDLGVTETEARHIAAYLYSIDAR